jgi:predicted nuclease with TOPRIM domain
MSKLLNRIDQIELKIKALINENQRLQEEALRNQERIQSLEKEIEVAHEAIKKGEESTIALKTANAMLGSEDYKTKTKLKINALVREIDQCIAQLA